MATKTWQVELEDGVYTVELEHSTFSRNRYISVNGEVVERIPFKLFGSGSIHLFKLDNHEASLIIQPQTLSFDYDLVVDGVSVQSGEAVTGLQPVSTPRWAWVFVVLCGLLIGGRGNLLFPLIGIAGAFGCFMLARDMARPARVRLLLCVGVTLACWVLFFLLGGSFS